MTLQETPQNSGFEVYETFGLSACNATMSHSTVSIKELFWFTRDAGEKERGRQADACIHTHTAGGGVGRAQRMNHVTEVYVYHCDNG